MPIRAGHNPRVAGKGAMGTDFSDRDAARARDSETGNEDDLREQQEANIVRIRDAAVVEQDTESLRRLREELLPLTDKKSAGRRLSEEAKAVLKSIEIKLAYHKHFSKSVGAAAQPAEAQATEQSVPEIVAEKTESPDTVGREIEHFKTIVDEALDDRMTVLNEVRKHLRAGTANKRDMEVLGSLKERTEALLASLSPEAQARTGEYKRQLGSVRRVQRETDEMMSQLHAVREKFLAGRKTDLDALAIESSKSSEPILDKTLDEKIDEIGQFLGDTLTELRDQNDLWKPGTREEDRTRMITSLTNNSEDYTEAEVRKQLSKKGTKILFDKIGQLRSQVKSMRELSQQRAVIEQAAEVSVDPIQAGVAALDQLSEGLAVLRANDKLWAEQPGGELPTQAERTRLLHRCVLDQASRSEQELDQVFTRKGKKDFLRTMPDLRALYNKSRSLKLQVSDELISVDATAAKSTEEKARETVGRRETPLISYPDFIRARDLTRAEERNLARLAERLALATASDAPPVPPPDVESDAPPVPPPDIESAMALPDMDLLDAHGDAVEAALRTGSTSGVYQKFEEMLEILQLEEARLAAMEKMSISREEHGRINSRFLNARNRHLSLTRRARSLLKKEHGAPAENVVSGVETTPIVEVPNPLGEKLVEARGHMLAARMMLADKNLNVERLNGALLDLDFEIAEIFVALDEQKNNGKEDVIFEAKVRQAHSDLRRLQERAERIVAALTQAELADHDTKVNPEEMEPELEFGLDNEDTDLDLELFADDGTQETVAPPIPPELHFDDKATDLFVRGDGSIQPKRGLAKVRETLSHTWSYIRNGWRNPGASFSEGMRRAGESQLRAVAEAEIAPKPVEVTRADYASALLMGAGRMALNLGLTYSGAAVVPEAYRYFTQKSFTKAEKAKIGRSINEALEWQEHKHEMVSALGGDEKIFQEGLKTRIDEALAKIEAAPYSAERKLALRTKIEALLEEHRTSADKIVEQQKREVAKALEAYITTTVSAAKVGKEVINSGLALGSYAFGGPVALVGARTAAYSVLSLYERQQNAQAQVVRGERSEARLTTAIQDGFKQWWSSATFKGDASFGRKSLNFAKATSQLGRAVGIGVAASEIFDEGVIDRLLEQFERRSESVPSGDLATYPGNNFEVPDREVDVPVVDVPDREVETPEIVPPVEGGRWFRGEIPSGSRVMGGSSTEGITYVLQRVIKGNPEAYGFDGESDIGAELFAKRMAVQITEGDGQMRRWLTNKAADKLNLFPELVDGEWHIAAVVDGKKLSMDELAELGYTSKAPATSK